MMEGLLLGAAVVFGLAALAFVFAIVSFVLWVVALPFHLLGWIFKGIGFLIALPFLLIAGIGLLAVFGVGALAFVIPMVLVPLAPVLFLGLLIWGLVRLARGPRTA